MSDDNMDRRVALLAASFAWRAGTTKEFFALADICVDWLGLDDEQTTFEPDEQLKNILNPKG